MLKGMVTFCGLVVLAALARAADLPEGGIMISPADTAAAFHVNGNSYTSAQVEKIAATGAPKESGLTEVLHVTTMQKPIYPWDIQFQARTTGALRKGDTLVGSVWLRGKASNGGKACVSFGLEKAGPPWLGTGWSTFDVGPDWKKFEVAMTVPDDFDAGAMQINLRVGYAPQELEFGNIVVTNYQRRLSKLKYQRLMNPRPPMPEPPMGRNLSFWAPQKNFAPALRQQVSLNGTWEFTPDGKTKNEIPVPEYWDAAPGFDCDQATYERTVMVPADWDGQRVVVEFEGVNYVADVFADDHPVGHHVGGFTSFKCDVTPYARPGQSFRLKVLVKGGLHPPIVDDIDKALWPVGWDGVTSRWGIVFPVWLRAYGLVNIADAAIRTSYRAKTIEVDYTLTNSDSRARNVTIEAEARRANATSVVDDGLHLTPTQITLGPGETRTVTVTTPWTHPALWAPENPILYHLTSSLVDGGRVVDQETRRFGFREIWIEKNYYVLNGVRFNFLGTSMHAQGEGYKNVRYQQMWPDNWGNLVDQLLKMNIRTVRFHQQPVPQWVLDVADEKGLVVIEESGVYARDFLHGVDHQAYLANAAQWIQEWVKDRRNHASILQWSAENECGDGVFRVFTNAELKPLGDTIHRYDSTRPVIYDGDGDAGDATLNYHYPEGGDVANMRGSIYQFSQKITSDRPVGIGEFMYDYGTNPTRSIMQGMMTRGLRYSGFADIRPYTLLWTLNRRGEPVVEFIRNSLAPVAVFDQDYDEHAIDVLLHHKDPILQAGSAARRTLLVYNDTGRDEPVRVEILLKNETTVLGQAKNTIRVLPGFHGELQCEFPVPGCENGKLDMILRAYQQDSLVFEEIRTFRVEGGTSAATPVTIRLNPAVPANDKK